MELPLQIVLYNFEGVGSVAFLCSIASVSSEWRALVSVWWYWRRLTSFPLGTTLERLLEVIGRPSGCGRLVVICEDGGGG